MNRVEYDRDHERHILLAREVIRNEARALGILKLRLTSGTVPDVVGNEIRFLKDTIPQDDSFRALAQTYRDEMRRTHLAVDNATNATADMVPGVHAVATYVGNDRCISCHPTAAAVWKQSAHAQAFALAPNQIASGTNANP